MGVFFKYVNYITKGPELYLSENNTNMKYLLLQNSALAKTSTFTVRKYNWHKYII